VRNIQEGQTQRVFVLHNCGRDGPQRPESDTREQRLTRKARRVAMAFDRCLARDHEIGLGVFGVLTTRRVRVQLFLLNNYVLPSRRPLVARSLYFIASLP